MGETGPCGPCTEIHIDRTPDKIGRQARQQGHAGRHRDLEPRLHPVQPQRGPEPDAAAGQARRYRHGLRARHGGPAGQGRATTTPTCSRRSWTRSASSPARSTAASWTTSIDIGFRVIADHLRMATFAITDGARPGNKKRDAVLRSVIRRAVRFGYQYFDLREPFLYKLVPVLVEQMGGAFPGAEGERRQTGREDPAATRKRISTRRSSAASVALRRSAAKRGSGRHDHQRRGRGRPAHHLRLPRRPHAADGPGAAA